MRPVPGEVLHFSEDPTIRRFRPHVAATARQPEAYVWAVDASRSPDYWFPRQCPRAMAWSTPQTTPDDRATILGPACDRVHAVEYGWLERICTVRLYAYRFAAADFQPFGEHVPHAHVATVPVEPLGPPEPVGDLFALHEAAGIQLRVLDNLWGWWNEVITRTVGFSGIRLGNAKPPPSRNAKPPLGRSAKLAPSRSATLPPGRSASPPPDRATPPPPDQDARPPLSGGPRHRPAATPHHRVD